MKKILLVFTMLTALIFTTTPVFAIGPIESVVGYSLIPLSEYMEGGEVVISGSGTSSMSVSINFNDQDYIGTVRNLVFTPILAQEFIDTWVTSGTVDILTITISSYDYDNDSVYKSITYSGNVEDFIWNYASTPFFYGWALPSITPGQYPSAGITVLFQGTNVTAPMSMLSLDFLLENIYVWVYRNNPVQYFAEIDFFVWLAQVGDVSAYTSGRQDGRNIGFIEGKEFYGHYDGQQWITAEEYGQEKYLEGLELNQLDIWSALWVSFTTPFTIFEIEIFPNVTFGMIALIPLVLGLIAFIFSLGGKKK